MVFIELKVKSTDVATHGHSRGVVTGIDRQWCPCTTERALCVHKGKGVALWTQVHLEGPADRPTDMAPTSVLSRYNPVPSMDRASMEAAVGPGIFNPLCRYLEEAYTDEERK